MDTKEFNVILWDPNKKKFIPYNVIPYLVKQYKEKKFSGTFEELKKFIKGCSTYQWWARCEYEIILSDWPGCKTQKKIDIHSQVMMNLDLITEIVKSHFE